jgi:hypothetical protein
MKSIDQLISDINENDDVWSARSVFEQVIRNLYNQAEVEPVTQQDILAFLSR